MAINLEEELYGTFEAEFVGSRKTREIEVVNFVLDGNNNVLYLKGPDGTIYNWSTIIRLKKLSIK